MRYIMLALFLISVVCYATVYMEKDPNGDVIYTDTPSANAQVVSDLDTSEVISTVTSVQSEQAAKKVVTKQTTKEEETPQVKLPYRTFEIISPKDQDTFQNERNIPVSFGLEPALQKGDMIQLYVDGAPAGAPSASPTINVGGLNRGTHQFYGVLMNEKKETLKQTAAITVYIKYANNNSRPFSLP